MLLLLQVHLLLLLVLLLLLLELVLLLLELVLLLLLLLLKLILELLFLYLLQDHEQVHCWAGGRGLAAGSCRSLRVVSRCCPAGRSGGGELRVVATRWPCQGYAAWVAILEGPGPGPRWCSF